MLEQFVTFERIEKHKAGEILFQGTVNTNDLPFPKLSNKGRGQVMMASLVVGD